MAKLTKVNTGNQDNSFVGCAVTGSSDSAASAYVKTVELSDGDVVSDGMIVVITFTNGNTAGNAPGIKTIYSSDQVNYYEDAGLTVPFTLAPAGCYDLEYTGTGNAYTYQSYPVLSIGDVTGPVCDYRGHKASGSLWEGGDEVQCMYKNGKFLLLGGSSTINQNNSYATTEQLTGGKWIDEKPIYRKAGHLDSVSVGDVVLDPSLTTSVVDVIVNAGGCAQDGSGVLLAGMALGCNAGGLYKLNVLSGTYTNFNWWVEYTKK